MKKGIKATAVTLIAAMAVGSVAGCSLFDKAGKLCKEVGDEYIQAALDLEFDDMAELCYEDDEAADIFAPYANMYEGIVAILEKASFEAGKADCSTKDGKGTIEYVITLPDYDEVIDEDPDDVDDFIDMLDDAEGTVEIKIELEFKLHKDDWLINNPEDLAEDLYDELLDIDFPFNSPYTEFIDNGHFYNSSNGTYTNVYYLDYDISQIDQYYSETWNYSFKVYNENGEMIYDSGLRTDSGLIENYCYLSDTDYYSSYNYFPEGDYTFVLVDSEGCEIIRDTCTVINTYD